MLSNILILGGFTGQTFVLSHFWAVATLSIFPRAESLDIRGSPLKLHL